MNNFPVVFNKKIYELKFMKPLENEAYAIIFEKVWAVIRKGYKNIDGGNSTEVYKEVLGDCYEEFFNEKMKVFDLNQLDNYNNYYTIMQTKKSDELWIKYLDYYNYSKINPKKVFEI